MRCSSCDTDIPAGTRFCPECGVRLAAPTVSTQGENRQLTVMFIDLVGATALSERLDPEELRDVVAAYQEHVGRVVRARGGTIAQYLGDGVLVYFGYPHAHEDDVDRSVLAGLDVLSGRHAMNDALERDFGTRLQLRLGVHTGEVVVAPVGDARERLAVGMSVNLAARICDATAADTLAISEVTRKLLGISVELESMGGLTLKGISEPVEAYRVMRDRTEEVSTKPGGERPFFGRDSELTAMADAFAAARDGGRRTVVLEGEAGMGKSRLLSAFRQRIAAEPHRWLEARCSHFHKATPLRPIASLTAQALELPPTQDAGVQLAHLQRVLADRREPSDHSVALLLRLFGLEIPPALALPDFSPGRIRADTMRAVVDAMEAVTSDVPSIIVIEDLHWIDPSSLEVIDALLAMPEAPMLLIVARRPDADEPWRAPDDAAHVELGRLEDDVLDDVITFHAHGSELASEVRSTIKDKADGIPLFAEELTKMVIELGVASGGKGSFGVPATLQDSLMARLDRLPYGKPVAQIAATIGRSFDSDLVGRVGELSADDAAQGFQQLVGADLVESIEGAGSDRYVFRHALIQDAAYRSLLRRDRVRVHDRIAAALIDTEAAITEPGRVAHHFAESEQPKQAIELWTRAGQTALAASAAKEAILHYQRALSFVEQLPGDERDGRELDLRIGLANATVATSGYGNSAVAEHFTRATEICDSAPGGQTPFAVASGLWGYQLVHGSPDASEAAVLRIKKMAETSRKPRHVFHAYYADGAQAFYTGQFERALASLTAANDMLSEGQTIRNVGTTDSATNCPMYLGWTEHMLGYCTQGLQRQIDGVASAEKTGKVFAQIEAMVHLVNLRHDRLEAEGTVEMCDHIIEMALEYGFNFWLSVCYSVRGWAKACCGETEDGILEANRGLKIFRSLGAYVPHVYRASCLVEALMAAGRHHDALTEIDLALERSAGRYDRFWDAEIFRLRALALLHTGAPGEAVEHDLQRAMALADVQAARSLALRATTTWAEWLQDQGRGTEAREPLRRRIEALEAGEDLADIRAANEVLAAL